MSTARLRISFQIDGSLGTGLFVRSGSKTTHTMSDIPVSKVTAIVAPLRPTKGGVTVPVFTADDHATAQKAATAQVLKKLYVQVIEHQIENGEIDDELVQAMSGMLDKKKAHTSTWVMVTVNPAPCHTVDRLVERIRKALTKGWVTDYEYCIEQRAETGPFHGYHAHILLKRNSYPPSHVQREMRSTFKALTPNHAAINFVWYTDKTVANGHSYVRGEKGNAPKTCFRHDMAMRLHHHLNALYSSNYEDEYPVPEHYHQHIDPQDR